MNPPSWIKQEPGSCLILLQIQPKASRTEIVGPHGEPPRLKIRVAAPPVEGAANDEILRFLKKKLKVTSAQLEWVRGEASKMKDLRVSGLEPGEILSRLDVHSRSSTS